MANEFSINGGQSAGRSRFAPIFNQYFSSGLVTQRNPLRPGQESALTNKLYGSKNDSLLDGLNVEVSNRLTLVRRPGSSVYNSQIFPAIDNFYQFRLFSSNFESIKIIADTATEIYDATGPSTKYVILNKATGSGEAYFQSVGNTLYIGDGVDLKKWIFSGVSWSAGTNLSLGTFIIDPNNDIQVVTTAGITGGGVPSWNAAYRGTTADGSVVWTNFGPNLENWGIVAPATAPTVAPSTGNRYWQPSTPLATYYSILDPNGDVEVVLGNPGPGSSTGVTTPSWPLNQGNFTFDGGLQWINCGVISSWVANTIYPIYSCIQDNNGNLQFVSSLTAPGQSGATAPTWNTTLGGTTTDNNLTWVNVGAGYKITSGPYIYAYSFHSPDGAVSTASPLSNPSGPAIGAANSFSNTISGVSSTDPQVDQIWIWRTVQGGSTLLFLDSIPNPWAGGTPTTWTYTDTKPDTDLNPLITAPINLSNNPPPSGLVKMTYHLGRIWGVVGNNVYFSGGPDVTTGDGNQAFPPANVFVFPDLVNRLYASTLGLFVFTVSDVYLIQGTTTTSFFSVPYLNGLGLQNYNAFDVNGSTVYFFTSDYQIVSTDLSTGVSEVGFNIGDQFLKNNWNASTARVTWHISGSADKGLYVSDYSTGWFRLYPTPAPESGQTWAPFAAIAGGCSQVQSVETSPGTHNLLIGPKTSGPILKRDSSVFSDNGVSYDANFLIGSLVLAQPGQLAELVFITSDSVAIGNRPTIAVQLDEIAPYSSGLFETLSQYVPDPPQLSPSVSMYSNRYYFSQTQEPALGRSLQIRMDWGNDVVQNELLSLTVFGGFSVEMS